MDAAHRGQRAAHSGYASEFRDRRDNRWYKLQRYHAGRHDARMNSEPMRTASPRVLPLWVPLLPRWRYRAVGL